MLIEIMDRGTHILNLDPTFSLDLGNTFVCAVTLLHVFIGKIFVSHLLLGFTLCLFPPFTELTTFITII